MSTTAINNLYLKWRVFRDLIGPTRSDAVIAEKFFGADEGPVKFSKLLRGDYGCAPDIGEYVAGVINDAVATTRKRRGLTAPAPATIRDPDLRAPVFEFARKLQAAAEIADADTLDRAHAALLQELSFPANRVDTDSRLTVERFEKSRMFETFKPSGGTGPAIFRPNQHLGRICAEDVQGETKLAYVMVTRDAGSIGKRAWDLDWRETVMWIPSPFVPTFADRSVLLMADPQPVSAVPGRFDVTVALVHNADAIKTLDPRGKSAATRTLDEPETARFLTNLRRAADPRATAKLGRRDVTVLKASYIVEV